jgi:glycosyltransferase involved in cell wall biosynthesis
MISIITPIYNSLEFFSPTVESVQRQTRGDWEWLIVDDGSSDGTLELCLEVARRDPRVHVLRHPNGANLGPSASRNLAIRHASGDFLALLDSDDIWIPEKLERDIGTFERHPRAKFLYSRILNWYDSSNPPEVTVKNKPGVLGIACDQLLESPALLLHVIMNVYDAACQLPTPCSVMMRRSVLMDHEELYEPTCRIGLEDVVMLVKVLLRHPAVVCDDIRSFYRRRHNSFSASTSLEDSDAEFLGFASWIKTYVSTSPKLTQEAVGHALAIALQRRTHYKRKMMLLSAGQKILPLRFREWLWQKHGKRGLVGR